MNNVFSHTKISFLKGDIVRFECSGGDSFSDKPTMNIPFKKIDNKDVKFVKKDHLISFSYADLEFVFEENKPLDTLKVLNQEGETVYSYKGKSSSGGLPYYNKTPYIFLLSDTPRIILDEEGYYPSSQYRIDKHIRDVYLLICKKDFVKLREQFISLAGNVGLPKLRCLGVNYHFSSSASEKDILKTIQSFKEHKIPFDNAIISSWKKEENNYGSGYAIDSVKFPKIREFIEKLHKDNVDVLFKDEPLPYFKKAFPFEKEEQKYRFEGLTSLLNLGVNGFYFDGNYSKKVKNVSKRIDTSNIANYIYHDVTNRFYQSLVLDPEIYLRPYLLGDLANKDNQPNDIASHRYGINIKEDISSHPLSLKMEVARSIVFSKDMISYHSSFYGKGSQIFKEDYIRYVQFASFSPIYSLYSETNAKSKEPWKFDDYTFSVIKNYIDVRYRLLYVLYTACYKNYLHGLGVIRPLDSYYPFDKRCIKNLSSYMINDSLLISPIVGEDIRKMDKKNYFRNVKVTLLNNKNKIDSYSISSLEEFEGLNQDVTYLLEGKIRFKDDAHLYLTSLVPCKVYIDNKLVLFDKNVHQVSTSYLKKIKRNVNHSFKIVTLEKKDRIDFSFLFKKANKATKKKIYLPTGEWYDVSRSNVYQGNRFVKKAYELKDMPIFVKAGSLLPLSKGGNSISSTSLRNIIYDFYPSREIKVNDFFYEDDGVSTGYQIGLNRINNYELSFDKENKTYFVKLFKTNSFIDDQLTFRKAILKMHVRDGEKIEKVTINDEVVKFYNHDHTPKEDIFAFSSFARDSKTMVVKFTQYLKNDYVIAIKIK